MTPRITTFKAEAEDVLIVAETGEFKVYCSAWNEAAAIRIAEALKIVGAYATADLLSGAVQVAPIFDLDVPRSGPLAHLPEPDLNARPPVTGTRNGDEPDMELW